MANLSAGKVQANFSLSAEVADAVARARQIHVRMDGTRTVRPSEYVEDVLRRDMIAKGLLPSPAPVVATRRPTSAKRKKKS